MKDLKERLKTVRELLTHAKLIRMKAGSSASGEANDWESQLEARAEELETEIKVLKEHEQQPIAAHV